MKPGATTIPLASSDSFPRSGGARDGGDLPAPDTHPSHAIEPGLGVDGPPVGDDQIVRCCSLRGQRCRREGKDKDGKDGEGGHGRSGGDGEAGNGRAHVREHGRVEWG